MSLFTEENLKSIPELYAQDGFNEEKVKVHLRVSLSESYNWLITEYSPSEQLFFGFVCLNKDVQNAELGYISKQELEDLSNKYLLEVEKVDIYLKEAKLKWIN